ncbi:MAG: hypothetical protein LJF15_08310 [Acidobacteria bacterium]|jgi:hypothetical protein|nr:hypothetical protein [Acidobacteriota bacterium]
MKRIILVAACAATMLMPACGGDSGSSPSPAPTPTPVPSATITSVGAGAVVVHPSADPAWTVSLYVPIRIQETSGGTATWNYARMSLWRNGVEVERGEIGADIIASPPSWADIQARQNETYAMVFGFNSDDFDLVTLTLGFSDKRDGRQFQVNVPGETFDGVNVSLEPLSRPTQSVHRLE